MLDVSQFAFQRWRQLYGAMKAEDANRLSQLEKENARLQRLLAEAELDTALPKDLVEENF
jgi:putative transposase